MNISGVNNLVHYNVRGKRILLLGESSGEGCKWTQWNSVNVAKYVSKLVNKTPKGKCIDIFLEGGFKKIFLNESDSSTSKIRKTLGTKPKKNLRVHNVDTKILPNDIGLTYQYPLMTMMSFFPENVPESFRIKLPEKVLLGALDYLLCFNKEKNQTYFNEIFRVIDEEFGVNFDSTIEIWEYIYFKTIEKELKKLDKEIISKKILIENLRTTYHYLIKKSGKGSYNEILSLLLSVPMDLYTLSRMFIKFNEKQSEVCDKRTIENVIICADLVHTITYEHFLLITFKKEPEIRFTNESSSDLCLSVKDYDFWTYAKENLHNEELVKIFNGVFGNERVNVKDIRGTDNISHNAEISKDLVLELDYFDGVFDLYFKRYLKPITIKYFRNETQILIGRNKLCNVVVKNGNMTFTVCEGLVQEIRKVKFFKNMKKVEGKFYKVEFKDDLRIEGTVADFGKNLVKYFEENPLVF